MHRVVLHEEAGAVQWAVGQLLMKSAMRGMSLAAVRLAGLWVSHPPAAAYYVGTAELLLLHGADDYATRIQGLQVAVGAGTQTLLISAYHGTSYRVLPAKLCML